MVGDEAFLGISVEVLSVEGLGEEGGEFYPLQ